MQTTRYFLSHSSKDKPSVIAIAEALGRDLCWLDEWNVRSGDDLLERIDAALGSATTRGFILFWSVSAEDSPWVKEEIAQARMRALLRGDIAIHPVLLDSAPRPLWMEHLVWIDGKQDPKEIAAKLHASFEVPVEMSTNRDGPDASFQNRKDEANAIENAFRESDKSIVIVNGPPGIGKRSLCRYCFQHRLPQLRVAWIDLGAAGTPATFYSVLAARMGLRLPEQVVKSGQWIAYWSEWIATLVDHSRDVLVLENAHEIALPDGQLPEWIGVPLGEWAGEPESGRLGAVLTTSRAIRLAPKLERQSVEISLGRIGDDDIIRMLRVLLSRSYPRRLAEESQLSEASHLLHGYPLAAQFWSAHAIRAGVELALLDPSPIHERVSDCVSLK